MQALLSKQRFRKCMAKSQLTNFRKVLKGKRYKRGGTEARDRKCTYTRANVLKMNETARSSSRRATDRRC